MKTLTKLLGCIGVGILGLVVKHLAGPEYSYGIDMMAGVSMCVLCETVEFFRRAP